MKRFSFLVLIFAWFYASLLHAQVEVNLKVKKDIIKGEPVNCTITLTNRTGGDLLLASDLRKKLSWMEFMVSRTDGKRMISQKSQMFRAAKVPFGKSISKTVNLASMFSLDQEGSYAVSVVVRTGEKLDLNYGSNRVAFSVAKGQTIWKQRIGVPGKSQDVREFRLTTFTTDDRTNLNVQVVEPKSEATYATLSLGEALFVNQPQAAIDNKNILHVLYMISPQDYCGIQMDYSGRILSRKFYKRGRESNPRLQNIGDGQVAVGGGIEFDPKAGQAEKATRRGLSDRPDGL